MGGSGIRKKDIEETRKFFQSLELGEWKERKPPEKLERGGQGTVITVEHINGEKGVFKHFKTRRPEALQRFSRELSILTDPQAQHQNIVKILDHSRDYENPWYISELGKSFCRYWKIQRKRYQDDPEILVKLATDIVLQILDGLSPLHDRGVVHRDIKPNNLIIMNRPDNENCPVLIDFGVAFVEEKDRLTPIDDAVGNRRFSPDVMMNRMDEITPWLDVFQTTQLLIWMISEKPTKDWIRPLDWRWVNYSNNLPNDLVLSIRALTALCSEEEISPKNATGLSSSIRELVVFTPGDESETGIDFDKIKMGISKGKSDQTVTIAKDIKLINASHTLADKVYSRLRKEIERIFVESKKQIYTCEKRQR